MLISVKSKQLEFVSTPQKKKIKEFLLPIMRKLERVFNIFLFEIFSVMNWPRN